MTMVFQSTLEVHFKIVDEEDIGLFNNVILLMSWFVHVLHYAHEH